MEKKLLENIVGKGENAGNQHFLLFSQCFLGKGENACKQYFLLFSQCFLPTSTTDIIIETAVMGDHSCKHGCFPI